MYIKNNFKLALLASATLFFSGCEFFDEMFQYDSYKQKQSSVIDSIIFDVNENNKKALLASECKYNKPSYIYYENSFDAHKNIFKDTKNLLSKPWSEKALKPHWDFRYVNRVSRYKNSDIDFSKLTGLDFKDSQLFIGTDASRVDNSASVAGVKCVNGKLAAGTTINLNDAPEQYLDYGGPHSTFIYRLAPNLSVAKPWQKNRSGNLLIQADFTKPIYKNFGKNIGGGVNFGLILHNTKTNQNINYVIGLYSFGKGWMHEQADVKYDPTTKMAHISTAIDRNSIYSTMSPKSAEIIKVLSTPKKLRESANDWSSFYRVNITYDNMIAVLQELRNNPPADLAGEDFGLSPQDWEVSSVMIQFELEEEGGKALLSGSFRGFEVYTSKLPL
jgi:hypothetical protein